MGASENLFVAPQDDAQRPFRRGPGALEVQGRLVVGRSPMFLPDEHCVTCDAALDDRATYHRRKLSWASPWIYLLLLLNILILLLVYLAVRKDLKLEFGQCRACHRRRRRRELLTLLLFMLSIPAFFVATFSIPLGVCLGTTLIIATLVSGSRARFPLSVKGYGAPYFRVAGCCEAFLARLDQAILIPDTAAEEQDPLP